MKDKLKKLFKRLCIYGIGFVAVVFIANHLPFILISGDSMYPTYNDGEFIRLTFNTKNIDRGDVVIFKGKLHFRFEEKLIKRVCGIPGDMIYTDSEGTYFVYNNHHIFYYEGSENVTDVDSFLETCDYKYTLGDSEYFFMGDNRDYSVDSRNFGPVSESKILAKTADGGNKKWQ